MIGPERERPEWVRAINAGEIAWLEEEAERPLVRDDLIGEAAARQGRAIDRAGDLERVFGRPGYEAEAALANLDRFVTAVETEAALTPLGRLLTRRFLLRLLEVRLQLMALLDADPGIEEEEIHAPLFVAGAPRTGTTILHALLAADSRHRVPEGWELLRPVPPPSPDPERFARDPRIELANRELVAPQTVVSGLLSIHEYGGRKPKECLSAMSFAFQSEEFTARHAVPSYADWLEASDMRPAYAMHRLVLRVLQRRRPTTRWVLKCPVHLHALPTLFKTYPDARVAITHRDPLTLLASLTSLIASLRWAHSDAVDEDAIAAAHFQRYRETFDRLVDWSQSETIPAAQIHHSQFTDFQRAPIETTRALYARLGIEWSPQVEAEMERALDAHTADRHGRHLYDASALSRATGQDEASLRAAFARYQTQFAVASDA